MCTGYLLPLIPCKSKTVARAALLSYPDSESWSPYKVVDANDPVFIPSNIIISYS